MLEVKNISSGYGKKQVLYNVSLQVNKGEVVLLTGGNGSGKTTLLKCIYNLLPLWSGEIWFEGERIDRLKPSELINKGIVYIPQKDFCFDNLTVEENLQISGNILEKNTLKERIKDVYNLTGLERLKKKKPFYLSGGEKKLLAFGMALVHSPKLYLFDEPFSSIDSKYNKIIHNLITDNIINNDIGLLIIEHHNHLLTNISKKIKITLGHV